MDRIGHDVATPFPNIREVNHRSPSNAVTFIVGSMRAIRDPLTASDSGSRSSRMPRGRVPSRPISTSSRSAVTPTTLPSSRSSNSSSGLPSAARRVHACGADTGAVNTPPH
jgi:hypothetical protein